MIGIFDSGYGGLTIFKEIEKKLPQHDFVYLGDNARTPYGERSQSIIYKYTTQAVDYLFSHDCDLIILACNTASALALRKIQQEYLPKHHKGKNVLGVIRPLAEEVGELSKNSKVAVLGTTSTVESGTYVEEFENIDRNIKVIQQACPLLVPLIEQSKENSPETSIVLMEYMRPIKKEEPDVVVLGCTHYGFLQNAIQNFFGDNTKVLDSGKVVAKKWIEYLENHPNIVSPATGEPIRKFLTTNSTEKFDIAAEKFLGRKIKSKTIKLT
ncbi:glutamate racemase [Candidatus Parcubacteria bacterium]|jgi:glutamate racemase|nr:glutamate racemase [Candidatus Parcubacteria bacterium]